MSTSCPHMNFEASVIVDRLTGADEVTVTGYTADVHVRCAECHQTFRFRHNAYGLSPDMATVGIDNTVLRVPLEPAYVTEIMGSPVVSGRA